MAISKAAAHHRGRIAALSRDRDPDDPELVHERQNLRALKLEEYVRRVVAEAPPLTADQLERIAGLIRSGGAA